MNIDTLTYQSIYYGNIFIPFVEPWKKSIQSQMNAQSTSSSAGGQLICAVIYMKLC